MLGSIILSLCRQWYFNFVAVSSYTVMYFWFEFQQLKGNAGSKRQHVHGCSLVRAKKIYGYHSSEELFVKIFLYPIPPIFFRFLFVCCCRCLCVCAVMPCVKRHDIHIVVTY